MPSVGRNVTGTCSAATMWPVDPLPLYREISVPASNRRVSRQPSAKPTAVPDPSPAQTAFSSSASTRSSTPAAASVPTNPDKPLVVYPSAISDVYDDVCTMKTFSTAEPREMAAVVWAWACEAPLRFEHRMKGLLPP